MDVHVVHASQTGNATEIARSIHTRLGTTNKVCPRGPLVAIDKFLDGIPPSTTDDPDDPSAHRGAAVFVVSTTGDGDAPDITRPFLKAMRRAKKDGKKLLAGWRFAILALGDTNYEEFCGGGRRVEKVLLEAGAVRMGKRGEADDALGLESFVEPWIDDLWLLLAKELGAASVDATPQQQQPNDIQLKKATLVETAVQMQPVPAGVLPSTGPELAGHADLLIMKTVAARNLSVGEDVKVAWHMELELDSQASSDLVYEPGDAFAVVLPNLDEDLNRLIQHLDVSAQVAKETVYQPKVAGNDLCPAATAFDLLKWRCDLTGPPRKTFLRALSICCASDSDKALLELLCAREGKEEYSRRFLNQQWTLMHLLDEVPTCRPTVELLLDQLAPLAPRYYSASSAVEIDGPRALHFAFTMVDKKVGPASVSRTGLATGHLETLCLAIQDAKPGEVVETPTVALIQRPSTRFIPPSTLETPYIMIGPGTGVAPFRGFLRQRAHRLRKNDSACGPGPAYLYFGNRYRLRDYFYGEELERYEDNDVVTRLQTAFSRDQATKRYVQHCLLDDEEQLADLLLGGGDQGYEAACRIYVCGDGGGMAKGVNDALVEIISGHESHSHESATALLQEWVKNGRYLKDIWFWGELEE